VYLLLTEKDVESLDPRGGIVGGGARLLPWDNGGDMMAVDPRITGGRLGHEEGGAGVGGLVGEDVPYDPISDTELDDLIGGAEDAGEELQQTAIRMCIPT